MEAIFNNHDVTVAAVRFSHQSDQVRFESYPRRLVFRGREYVLAEQ
jgi:hypothetical protein